MQKATLVTSRTDVSGNEIVEEHQSIDTTLEKHDKGKKGDDGLGRV